MPHDLTLPVDHVSDTAYMVAAYRLLESQRSDAHFHDDLAEKLLGPAAQTYLDQAMPAKFGSWMMAVRTTIIDRWIEAKVKGGVDLVVNLAAGLDTRPYRLASLPSGLNWLEVDFAPIINHKNHVLSDVTPRCHVERLVADLSRGEDRERLFAKIEQSGTNILVLTEGLLIYLEESTVREIAMGLHAISAVKWWISEFSTPRFMAWAVSSWSDVPRYKSTTPAPAATPVGFRFVPEDLPGYFAHLGWVIDDFSDFIAASHSLERLPPSFGTGTEAATEAAIAGSGYGVMAKASLN